MSLLVGCDDLLKWAAASHLCCRDHLCRNSNALEHRGCLIAGCMIVMNCHSRIHILEQLGACHLLQHKAHVYYIYNSDLWEMLVMCTVLITILHKILITWHNIYLECRVLVLKNVIKLKSELSFISIINFSTC